MGPVLGINAWHGDSAAALVVDGRIVAAVEEERFRRVKHWAGFPDRSIRYCLEAGGIDLRDVVVVAINRDPRAHLFRKVLFAVRRIPSPSYVADRLRNASRVGSVEDTFREAYPEEMERFRGRFVSVHHHVAHLASAHLLSGYDESAVCSVDGFGDFVSTMTAHGRGPSMTPTSRVFFPHSLGIFYLALTQFLGFPRYGDEYKVMGLSGYGNPSFLPEMRRIVRTLPDGSFRLDLSFFVHHSTGVPSSWDGSEPTLGVAYSPRMVDLLGPPRSPEASVEQRHMDLAASLQARFEECLFHLLGSLHKATRCDRLSLAGGCAMNSLANGRIVDSTPFREIFIQPAAYDAGGALGAALVAWHAGGGARLPRMETASLGPGFGNDEIGELIRKTPVLSGGGFLVRRLSGTSEVVEAVAERLVAGKVVGWFQGRTEWGARALGNRSIVVDPRRSDMKELLNAKIKRRESFRPFAPSILREAVADYFETDDDVPFMQQVLRIRPEKRDVIPAVAHVDGTGRLQTVTRAQNERYYLLIEAFGRRTGVPIVLNTSFNENEPIVNRPEEALDCFLRTRMDVLSLGDFLVERV